jgi:membrane-associated phospholipid phosphatase
MGVHYPLDVIGGAVLGAIIGRAASSFYNRHFTLEFKRKSTDIRQLP